MEATVSNVTLEANGIGYKILIPVNLLSKLSPIGQNIHLYTSFIIRENSQSLYGFMTSAERDLFEALQGVTGIGPKLALCIVGNTTLKSLHLAISSQDILAISKIPGIGKKTAERLIIELKDKLATLFPSQDFAEFAIQIPLDSKQQQINDAMSALINLGYNQMTAEKAIKKTLKELSDKNIDLGTLIGSALQNI